MATVSSASYGNGAAVEPFEYRMESSAESAEPYKATEIRILDCTDSINTADYRNRRRFSA